jgi:hypothetical protein
MPAKALNRTHCTDCGTELIRDVNTVPNRVFYIQGRCKTCWNKHYTERNKQVYDPLRERDRQLRKNFGISLEEYTKMYNDQGGVCAICNHESDTALHVDHNHTTNDIRGLLCHKCNHALGQLNEDLEIITNMYEYILKWSK